VTRHDYLPFGEELFAGTGGRTTAQGYAGGDGVRQQFTQKERDIETGLDYFGARYYASTQGRFTSPDQFTGGPRELFDFSAIAQDNPTFYADLTQPQSLNKYQYCLNSPLSYLDPDGHQQALTQRIMVEQGGYFAQISKRMDQAYDSAVNAIVEAKNEVVGFRQKVQKALGTDRDSLIERSMSGPFALPRDKAEEVADISIAFNDGLVIGPTKGLQLEEAVAKGLSANYVVTRGDAIGQGMADILAVAKNGKSGIVMEVTGSATKSITTIRKQLEKGMDHMASNGVRNYRPMVTVFSERAAARLREELPRIRGQIVEIVVGVLTHR
jgi:RHS repeat-associated protein